MAHNASRPHPQSFPMDVAQFFKSLSNLTMDAKYRAQDDYISQVLEQIKTDRKKMHFKSESCAQMAQSKMPEPQMKQSDKSYVQLRAEARAVSLADKIDGLAELAKLYNVIANLPGESKNTVEKRWKVALLKSLDARMSAIEDLQAGFNDVMEVKRRVRKLWGGRRTSILQKFHTRSSRMSAMPIRSKTQSSMAGTCPKIRSCNVDGPAAHLHARRVPLQ